MRHVLQHTAAIVNIIREFGTDPKQDGAQITHCYKKGAILSVVKASVVRRFLAELFGESGQG